MPIRIHLPGQIQQASFPCLIRIFVAPVSFRRQKGYNFAPKSSLSSQIQPRLLAPWVSIEGEHEVLNFARPLLTPTAQAKNGGAA